MLPKSALAALDKEVPDLTPELANGLAVTHMADTAKFIDSVFRAVAKGFPPGLLYLGCRRLTPQEELAEVTRPKNSNRRTLDIAPSSVYMMEYKFQFENNAPFTRIMYLPYVHEAGTIFLSGSRFVVSPVLADRVISVPSANNIFVRLLKAKLTINCRTHFFETNVTGHETHMVVWSKVYNEKNKPTRPAVKADTTMVHYLLCRYGMRNMFAKFLGHTPVVGTDEVNEENYPKKDWVICASTGLRPTGVRAGGRVYQPTNIRLAIRREHFTTTTKQVVAGFFYVVDHYPQRMRAEYVDDTELWKVLLGRALWAEEPTDGRILNDIDKHFNSLDSYIDTITARKFQQIGYQINDVYELFFLVLKNFNDWMAEAPVRVVTMYDKELSILPFICYGYVDLINKLCFKLMDRTGHPLTQARVQEMFAKYLKLGLIFHLARDSGLISTASTSGDCMAFKLTGILVSQSASIRAKTSRRATLNDPGRQLHSSLAEVGSYAAMPKSSPDGRSRLNLCVKIDSSGLILRNDRVRPVLDSAQDKIRLKDVNR